MAWQGVAAKQAGPIATLLVRIRFLFLFVFFIFVIFNAVIVSFEQKNPMAGVSYLGDKLLYPTLTLQEESNKILNNEGFIMQDGIWETLKIYSGLLSSLLAVMIWFWVLKWFALNFIMWDNSKGSSGALLAIIFFFLIQASALAIKGESPMIVWDAFMDFGRAAIHMTKGIIGIGDKYIPEINNNTICKINSSINGTC
jgi:hypothetical protein